jgi:hypothetical protein
MAEKCMTVLRHMLTMLCEVFSVTRDMTDDLNPLDFYLWRHLATPVYAALVDNEEAYRIVDACQTIYNYPGIFERM